MESVHGHSSFVCEYCGKSFKWYTSLNTHRRSLHKVPGVKMCWKKRTQPVSHVCGKCGKIFSRVYNLKRHEDAVHREVVNESRNKKSVDVNTAGATELAVDDAEQVLECEAAAAESNENSSSGLWGHFLHNFCESGR